MPSDHVEVVRRLIGAWSAAEFEPPREDVDPAVTVDWSESNAPYAGVYVGFDGWRHLWEDLRTVFEDATAEVHGYLVAGPNVAVRNTSHLLGRDGIEVTASSTIVFTFKDDKLVHVRLFQDDADALAAIGYDDRG